MYLVEQPEPERLEEEGGDAVEEVADGEHAHERRVEPDGLQSGRTLSISFDNCSVVQQDFTLYGECLSDIMTIT